MFLVGGGGHVYFFFFTVLCGVGDRLVAVAVPADVLLVDGGGTYTRYDTATVGMTRQQSV